MTLFKKYLPVIISILSFITIIILVFPTYMINDFAFSVYKMDHLLISMQYIIVGSLYLLILILMLLNKLINKKNIEFQNLKTIKLIDMFLYSVVLITLVSVGFVNNLSVICIALANILVLYLPNIAFKFSKLLNFIIKISLIGILFYNLPFSILKIEIYSYMFDLFAIILFIYVTNVIYKNKNIILSNELL